MFSIFFEKPFVRRVNRRKRRLQNYIGAQLELDFGAEDPKG